MKNLLKLSFLALISLTTVLSACNKTDDTSTNDSSSNLPDISNYPIVSTNQTTFYDNTSPISNPAASNVFYAQDAAFENNSINYIDNGDGTITDNVSGLMWSKTADMDGDGDIDANDKLTYTNAVNGASTFDVGGYDDWRLPTIKELYSLIIFSGVDPSGFTGSSTSGLIPFIDTNYFDFAYGDTGAGERIIDAQYASSTKYVSLTMIGDETLFGVNFADGRIKGYGLQLFGQAKTFFVAYVRGNTNYGKNDFVDNGDSTITDNATGLMWTQYDSSDSLNWEEALQFAADANIAGHTDWRLPDAKELQSIVDYSRSPSTTSSAAIDPLFSCTQITNEAGQTDYPAYWTGTTHSNWTTNFSGGNAVYVNFGRAMGYMNGQWMDVHGAGAQRSDPKMGNPSDYPQGNGPQGDAIRIYNYVRLVRQAN